MAIHRTHIVSALGGKAERMALGPFFGSAIKLWPLKKGDASLTIGEGIENVLSAVELEVGTPPAWAATVAGNLSRVPGDQGRRASDHRRRQRSPPEGPGAREHPQAEMARQGREVLAKMPSEVGKDFNDVLRGRS